MLRKVEATESYCDKYITSNMRWAYSQEYAHLKKIIKRGKIQYQANYSYDDNLC